MITLALRKRFDDEVWVRGGDRSFYDMQLAYGASRAASSVRAATPAIRCWIFILGSPFKTRDRKFYER